VWLLNTGRRMDLIYDHNPNAGIVIKDGRFRNELDFVRAEGGKVIRIKRGPEPEWFGTAWNASLGVVSALEIMQTQYADVHVSEWDWIGQRIDLTIENDGTIADLHEKVAAVMRLYA